MAQREEDVGYGGGGERSPQAAREAFGEPDTWMRWRIYFDDIGSYSGFKNQDKNRPFIFYGGGFDDKIKYVGAYTAICNGIVPIFNEHVQLIYKIDPQLTTSYDEENYFPFNAFPSTVSINNTISNKSINCDVYPTNWVSGVEVSQHIKNSDSYEEWLNIIHKIKNMAKPMGFVEVSQKYMTEKHIIGKFKHINNENIYFSFFYLGEGVDVVDHIDEDTEIVLAFILPEELIKYKNEIVNSEPAMITFCLSNPTSGYLILKNGLYLKLLGPVR